MSQTDIVIEGLDEFEKKLVQIISHDYPHEFEQMVIQVATDLQAATADATPVLRQTNFLEDGSCVLE